MKTNYAGIVLLGILLLPGIFLSCNKYPDGPKFTLLGRKDRMEGEWDLKETIAPDGSVDYDNSNDITELTEDNDYHYISGNITVNGKWAFEDKKANVVFKIGNTALRYKILRLKDQQLWLQDVNNNDILKYENTDD